jgi:hypothetical protein
VATYDLKPEMSAFEVTDRLVEAIASGSYDAIVCNYANGDMVGHTGSFDAAVKAVEALDVCLGRIVAATLGQSLLARRGRAVSAEKKPLLDDLRRILLAYLQPVLEPPVVTTSADATADGRAAPKATAKKR